MDGISEAEKRRRMKALTLDERIAAIDASPNVVGFERMTARAQQVARAHGYRSPDKPEGGA